MKSIAKIMAVTFLTACSGQSVQSDPTLPDQNKGPITDVSDIDADTVSVTISQIYQSPHCGASLKHQWLSSMGQLASVMSGQQSRTLLPGRQSTKPEVNFADYGVAVISMGQQRTGGYSVGLTGNSIEVNQTTAALKVNWREPAKGMIVTQALTSPCLMVKIPLKAINQQKISTINIVDQNGMIRGNIKL